MFWLAVLASMTGAEKEVWYGPSQVSFELAVEGSPYDGQSNDVRVRFENGPRVETRIAYYDQGQWRAVLASTQSGTYQATVLRNGQTVRRLSEKVELRTPLSEGFVRVAQDRQSFRDGLGRAYWPVGHNLGWADRRTGMTVPQQLAEMGRHGLNWARIWACSWDGKNPFFSEGATPAKGRDLLPSALSQWEGIVGAAAKSGVRFQFVLFHHGMFSTKTDANWDINSWNIAKGGFLAKPEEFFTNFEAKARAKNWLRYAVARWGHEPAILAWELFNEVEWVDAFGAGKGEDVGRWHDEMADYLRSIDPYRHLVVSSSGMNLPIWRKLDYYQPHGYPPDIKALVLGTKPTTDKPLFYGEVGLGGGPKGAESERQAVRSALWSALMAGHAGAAQYWYWDRVVLDKLYPEFERFAKFFRTMGMEGPRFGPVPLEWTSRKAGAISFAAGQGWAKTTKFEYHMPQDAENGSLGSLSGFIQGPDKKDMMAEPIRFVFEAAEAGRFELTVGTIAKAGAEIRIQIDGETRVAEKVAAQERDRPLNRTFSVAFGPGKHTVTLDNPGPDWFTVDQFRIDGIGQAITGSAARNGRYYLLRLGNRVGTAKEPFSIARFDLPDGPATVHQIDLDSGQTETTTVEIKNGQIKGDLAGRDVVWFIKPKA